MRKERVETCKGSLTRRWELSGVMELRDATWTRVTGDCELAVRWYHDPAGPDYAQLLAANPKKCMDQIQGNGPDGDLKMGNLSQMINMRDSRLQTKAS